MLFRSLDEVGYRSHGFRWKYRFFYGSLEGIDREKREVIIAPIKDEDGSELISRHRIRYDYLVLAFGGVSNDFGIPGVKEHCLFLDNREQADRFRQKLLNNCLRVSRSLQSHSASEAFVKVAIVGAGATGVELAAELFNAAAGLRHYGLEVFDEKRLQVTLIEAGPRISETLGEFVARFDGGQMPPDIKERAKLLMLDAIGIAFASSKFEFAHRSLAALQEFGRGDSELIGMSPKLGLRDAAMLNGILVHGLDYDDTYLPGSVHLTASSVPVALGVAASADASGDEIDRKSTRLNSSHVALSRMPSSA